MQIGLHKMEASQAVDLSGEDWAAPAELLPDIQDLRKHFREIALTQDDRVARAFLLTTEVAELVSTTSIEASPLHSQLFFNAVAIYGHEKLEGYYRNQVLMLPDQDKPSARSRRFAHKLQCSSYKRAMQDNMAQLLMASPGETDRKVYNRLRGIILSANFLFDNPEIALAQLGLGGMVTEHAILNGVREVWPNSSLSNPSQDIRRAIDVLVKPSGARPIPLQVKHLLGHGENLYRGKQDERVPRIYASTDLEKSPFNLSRALIGRLADIVQSIKKEQSRRRRNASQL